MQQDTTFGAHYACVASTTLLVRSAHEGHASKNMGSLYNMGKQRHAAGHSIQRPSWHAWPVVSAGPTCEEGHEVGHGLQHVQGHDHAIIGNQVVAVIWGAFNRQTNGQPRIALAEVRQDDPVSIHGGGDLHGFIHCAVLLLVCLRPGKQGN